MQKSYLLLGQTPFPDHSNTGLISFAQIDLDIDYRKKWNENMNDFIVLTKSGNILRNQLYRIGGFNNPDPKKDKYFVLVKYSEAFYTNEQVQESEKFTGLKHTPNYLKSSYCILDQFGNELYEFDMLHSPYIIGGCIFKTSAGIFNIKTGHCYSKITNGNILVSKEFVFITSGSSLYPESVYKVSKSTGDHEIIE